MSEYFLQAIKTKYIGPTNYSGSKILARASAGRIMATYDHALSVDVNHRKAAQALAAKFGWEGKLHGGVLHDGTYVFVFDNEGIK